MTTTLGMKKSWELHGQALQVIPMATQTHSKAPREALRGIERCFLVRGKGCRVWDLDGNEYIDFRNGLGPITLGYFYPTVDDAIRQQMEDGIIFSYPHPLEVEVAERLVRVIPCAERVRFLKTGGEAMTATQRLARAFTGRDLILTCGYPTVGPTRYPGQVYRRQPNQPIGHLAGVMPHLFAEALQTTPG